MYQTIMLDYADGIATIALNRPQFSNAFAAESYEEIQSALSDCGNDPQVRVILLTGAGKHFSAGGGIHTFKARIESGAYLSRGVVKAGAMYYLQRMVGTAKTLELMAFGSMINGEEAHRLGLATQLVPDEQLHQAAEALARQLAAKPTQAIARQKRLMYEFFYRELSAFHQRKADFMREASMTDDHKEAVDAFLEKRSPQFSGT